MLKSYLVLHITASLLDLISIHFHFYLRNLLILLHLGSVPHGSVAIITGLLKFTFHYSSCYLQ